MVVGIFDFAINFQPVMRDPFHQQYGTSNAEVCRSIFGPLDLLCYKSFMHTHNKTNGSDPIEYYLCRTYGTDAYYVRNIRLNVAPSTCHTAEMWWDGHRLSRQRHTHTPNLIRQVYFFLLIFAIQVLLRSTTILRVCVCVCRMCVRLNRFNRSYTKWLCLCLI